MPGRWAAPPAPATITSMPREAAPLAYSTRRSGVLCADTIVVSHSMPSSARTREVPAMTARSESEPMIIPTSTVFIASIRLMI